MHIQSRATRQFDRVMMAKPDEVAAAAFLLAPLILVEATAAVPSPVLPVEVLTWTNRALLRSNELTQVAFAWQIGDGSNAMQGVRLALDADGHPVIWEVLKDSSNARVLYVTQSLEAEAMRQHGAPLPGHRFWIEPKEGGRVVIAGVLDEASVPMGPIVYVEQDGEVSAIICRCMPAQAREVSGTQFYRIREIHAADWRTLPGTTRRQLKHWWRGCAPEDLTRVLRIRAVN